MGGRSLVRIGVLVLFILGIGFPRIIYGQAASRQYAADIALIGHAVGLWVVADSDSNDGVLDQVFNVVGQGDHQRASATMYLRNANLGWDGDLLWLIGAVEGRQRLVLRVNAPTTAKSGEPDPVTPPVIEFGAVEGIIDCRRIKWQRLETLVTQLHLSSADTTVPITEMVHLASEESRLPGFLTQFGDNCKTICRPGTEPPNCRPTASGE